MDVFGQAHLLCGPEGGFCPLVYLPNLYIVISEREGDSAHEPNVLRDIEWETGQIFYESL